MTELGVEVQRAGAGGGVPSTRLLKDWARAAWRAESRSADVVVRITGERESRRLNRDYRGKDRPTNVLSFASEPLPGIGDSHVGDLVICEGGEPGRAAVCDATGLVGARGHRDHRGPQAHDGKSPGSRVRRTIRSSA